MMISYRTGFWMLLALVVLYAIWQSGDNSTANTTAASSKFVLVTGGPGSYWELAASGAKAAAKDFNVQVEVRMPEQAEDLQQQMQILSQLNAAEWGGIALSPLDADQQTRLINRLASETHVLTFDSDAPLSNRLGYVGTSNYGAGTLCAKLVREAQPLGGKIAVLMANRTKANLLDRKSGFDDNVNRPLPGDASGELAAYEIVDYLVDEGDSARCAELIREVLIQHPDLAGFVAMNARHGPILLDTLGELEKLGQVKLVTFDHNEKTLQGIEDGHIFATIAQDPYNFGYEAVRILVSGRQGKRGTVPVVGGGSWNVPTEVIRQENLEDFRKRLQERKPKKEKPTAKPV